MTEDGLRALTLDEVAQKDWEKKKIWPRPPPYGTKSYNTKLCPLKDSEKDLFMFRIKKDGEEEKTQIELFKNKLQHEGIKAEMVIIFLKK